jgi:hypothetical protein
VKAIDPRLLKVVGDLIIEIYHSDVYDKPLLYERLRHHKKSREFIIMLVGV